MPNFRRPHWRRACGKFRFYAENSETLHRGSQDMYLDACTGPMPDITLWKVCTSFLWGLLFDPFFPLDVNKSVLLLPTSQKAGFRVRYALLFGDNSWLKAPIPETHCNQGQQSQPNVGYCQKNFQTHEWRYIQETILCTCQTSPRICRSILVSLPAKEHKSGRSCPTPSNKMRTRI